MLDSKFEILVGIVGVFGTLLVIVIGTITASLLKKKVPDTVGSQDALKSTSAPGVDSQATLEVKKKSDFEALESPEKPLSEESSTDSAPLVDPLKSTRDGFWGRIQSLFSNQNSPDLEALEEVLYTSDLGPQTVERLLGIAGPELKKGMSQVREKLKLEISDIFDEAQVLEPDLANPLKHLSMSASPTIWLVVGINGAGKTTTIGKISAQLALQGKKVLVAAGDTFRAAAGSQLKTWTDRAQAKGGQVEIFHPEGVQDPSAVAFDAASKAKARGFDVLIIDTAGRLNNQSHLMDELKKVKRVIQKVIPEAPHECLLVLDANNGQNALNQAREFHKVIGVTGVVLTKMDGTAKGGVAVGVSQELKVPIRLLGLGEKVEDLRPFSAKSFVDSILD